MCCKVCCKLVRRCPSGWVDRSEERLMKSPTDNFDLCWPRHLLCPRVPSSWTAELSPGALCLLHSSPLFNCLFFFFYGRQMRGTAAFVADKLQFANAGSDGGKKFEIFLDLKKAYWNQHRLVLPIFFKFFNSCAHGVVIACLCFVIMINKTWEIKSSGMFKIQFIIVLVRCLNVKLCFKLTVNTVWLF